jgi:serine/threonine protein kinase
MLGILNSKYELVELAGEGGMAHVYRGYTLGAEGFRRPVAVKRILEGFADNAEFLEMFVEEARVSATIHHPNVVQIHDFDRDDAGHFYLVMEWVPGVNLLDWCEGHRLRGQRTPWHLVAAVGIEVSKGLGAAHENHNEQGGLSPIYHRDVTPQNVLISQFGYVKLTDFGLARATDRARITREHIVKGKVSYLAPELTEGGDPSPQSDLFGLGVLLWESLMGRKLFHGDGPVDVVRAIQAAVIPSVCAERPKSRAPSTTCWPMRWPARRATATPARARCAAPCRTSCG